MLELTPQEVELESVPIPKKTDTYTPIPHMYIAKLLYDNITEKGYHIARRYYISDANRQKLVGKFVISGFDPDIRLQIAFKNSYDKSTRVACAAGAEVFVCSNGMIVGQFMFSRKHTGTVDEELKSFIDRSVNLAIDQFADMVNLKNFMKTYIMTPTIIYQLLGELYLKHRAINTTQLSLVRNLLDNPIYDYGDKFTAWAVFNTITQAIDTYPHPTRYFLQHGKTLNLFKQYMGITVLEEFEEEEEDDFIIVD